MEKQTKLSSEIDDHLSELSVEENLVFFSGKINTHYRITYDFINVHIYGY